MKKGVWCCLGGILLFTCLSHARKLSLYTEIMLKNQTGSAVQYRLVESLGPISGLFFVGDTEGRVYRKPRKLFDIGMQTVLEEKKHTLVILDIFNPLKTNVKCKVGIVLETEAYQARVQSVITDGSYCLAQWNTHWFKTDTIAKGVVGKPVYITITKSNDALPSEVSS